MNLIEVIVVDDGSYEEVETVIRKYESYLPLKYIRQTDRGYRLAEVRSFGMRAARHDFFIFLDGDVIASPQLVEAYMQFFHVYERMIMTGQTRFVCTDSITDDSVLEDINVCLNLPDVCNDNTQGAAKSADGSTVDPRLLVYVKTNFLKRELFPFFCINGWTYALSRKALQECGGNDEDFQAWGSEEVEQAYRFYNAGYYCIPVTNVLGLHQEPPIGQQVSRIEGKIITSVLFEEKCPAPYTRTYHQNKIYQVPKVSIYIPAYNVEKYIQAAIESALKQTYTDFEIVIVDDGSTDNTLKIIEENYTDNPRVRWFTQANQGTAKTSNKAISLCRGMYIGQLDADDLLKPNALEMTVAILDQHNVGYVCSQYDIIDEHNNYIRKGYSLPFSREWLIVSNIAGSFRLFRKRDFIRCGGFDETLETAEDYDLALRMAETCDFYFIPEVLYSYRWHGQNTSIVKREQQEIDHVNCINKALYRMGLAKTWEVVAGDVNKRDVKFIKKINDHQDVKNHELNSDDESLINIGSNTKFVVLGFARSGSTLLTHLLKAHPGIVSYSEIFNTNNWTRRKIPKPLAPLYTIDVQLNPKKFLNGYWQTHQTENCIGFKYLNNQCPLIEEAIITTHCLKKIIIYRENLLKQFVSYQIALRTKVWNSYQGIYDPIKIMVDLPSFFKYAEKVNHTYDQWYKSLGDQEYLLVKYEDLVANVESTFHKVCQFLNQPIAKAVFNLKKQNSDNLVDLIENYEEVANALKGTEYEKFLFSAQKKN